MYNSYKIQSLSEQNISFKDLLTTGKQRFMAQIRRYESSYFFFKCQTTFVCNYLCLQDTEQNLKPQEQFSVRFRFDPEISPQPEQ